MKWPKLNSVIFGVNLGVLVSAGLYFYTRNGSQPTQATEPPATPEAVQEAPAPPVVEKVVTQTVTVTNPLSWRMLESEDYPDYIRRLRSIGCPEQTIRDIIIADLDKLYAPRVQALKPRHKDLKYWNSEEEELANEVNPQAQTQKKQEIDAEKRRIIEQLLGIDLVRERLKQQGEEDYYERRLSFLPEAKRDIVRQLLEGYDSQEQAIRSKEMETGEPITPADRVELRRLDEEKQARLAATLSPEENAQIELWLSPSADAVRHDMYGMNASEPEFQAVYQLQKNFDQQWGQQDPELMDNAARAQYEAAKAQLEAQIRQSLGEQRYAEYQRGSDEAFHRLSATVARFNLPKETAVQVYELKRTLTSMNDLVKNDPNLTPEQKDKALKAMADETEKQVESLLGDSAFKYYVWRGQGFWIGK